MKKKAIQISLIVLLLVAASGILAVRASPLAFDLDWHVIGGGGGSSTVGIYTLDYTMGQPVAGVILAGPYDLCAGFWCLDWAMEMHYIHLPLVMRGS